ncbi:glycosyltransferase family 4 protein [Trichocoleus desertorum AS-A10]|uniref:glycosyltransferase family 4 protein n=1 Tax=Trichocoleus desertorum TaxID=1481672 RepID=UPI003296FABA
MSPQPAKNRQKISVITPDLSGGGVTRAYLLSQVLQKLDYDVEVVGFLFGPSIYPNPPIGLPVHAFPGCNYPRLLSPAKQLLDQVNGDIIYAIKPRPTSFGMALLKQLFSKRPVVLDIDDWELSWYGGDKWAYRPTVKQLARDVLKPEGALRQPEHPLYLKWSENLVSRANAITVDTQFLQDRFGGTYLPNGKDTALFDPEKYDLETSRERYGLSGYRVLMFPGTPRPHKGLEDVLLALEMLNEPDLRLVMVGGRRPDDYDRQLVERWGQWIIQLPRYPVEQMPEIVAAAHVVVVPQRDTPTAKAQFPLKLTDGMAMAKPILSTKVGDIPTILAGVGYLVEPNSPEQIAEQLRAIFQDWESACQLGLKARQKCIEHYSTDAMASTLEELLGQLK